MEILRTADLDAVVNLLKVAYKHRTSENVGIHGALLSLVARRGQIGTSTVHWGRSYRIAAYNKDSDLWVTLQAYLLENGYDMSKILGA